jgi:2-oxo-hept-3-ene-1,7-dioate hydratase
MIRWTIFALLSAALFGVWSTAAQADDAAAETWAELVSMELAKGRPMPMLTAYDWDLDLAAAYAVQRELVDILYGGLIPGGYKAGLTTATARKKYYVREPISGALPRAGRRADGAVIDAGQFKKPMIEIELGFIVRSPIRREMKSVSDLETYIRYAVPAIELPDVNYEKPNSLTGLDLVATNIAASGYVIGKPFLLRRLAEVNAIKVTLTHDGKLIDEGMASTASGNQLAALVSQGHSLYPDQVLMTGSLGKINPGLPGRYHAQYGDYGKLDFELKASSALAASEAPSQ